MSDKLVSLHGGIIGAPVPNKDLVEELERLLEMAQSGEIVAGAIAFTYRDGTSSTSTSGYVGAKSMIGAIEVMKFEILAEILTY